MRRFAAFVPFAIALASACGSSIDAPPTGDDAGTTSPDGSAARDASTSKPGDASAERDASPERDAAADTSTPADASVVPPTRKGQCFTDAHCGAGLTCVAGSPGGFCSGCGGSCSVGPADQCNFGTCNESCTKDEDCTPGLRCNASGTCILKSCAGTGTSTCGPFHSCQSGFCRRISCAAGETCPSGTDCKTTSAGRLCVETFLTFP